MMKQRIVMRVSEAIRILEEKGSTSAFYKELKEHKPNDWLVQGDMLDNNGRPKFFVLEDNEENSRILMQHAVIDLSGIEEP